MQRTIFLFILIIVANCCKSGNKYQDSVFVYIFNEVVSDGYIGNGAEWDPYQLNYGNGRMEISEADQQKIYDRLDFMQPKLMRVMINTSSFVRDGKLLPETNIDHISWILNYCQSRDVTVIFGDWGGRIVNVREQTINRELIAFASQYVDYLINEKGFTCIKHYNLINEPNGNWSATRGNYSLWANAMKTLHQEFEKLNLIGKISLVGPDVAIWTTKETWWVDSLAVQMDYAIGLYDIHTYPSKSTVNSGEYTEIIHAYQKKVPAGKKIVMGEIGLKFVTKEDSMLNRENIRRAQSKPYASIDDSQMFVYDYTYGIDIADALFQTANAGYSGSIVWMLDDAMHSKEAPDKLKVWGFWNIFGDDFFGAEEEKIRPWYYAWSLLCRNMPPGCRIMKTETSVNASVRSLSVEKGNKRMLALVNVSKEPKKVTVKHENLKAWSNVVKYVYSEGNLIKEGDNQLLPNEKNLRINFHKGITLQMPAESLIVYTDF